MSESSCPWPDGLYSLQLTLTNQTDRVIRCMHPKSSYGFLTVLLMEPDGKPVQPDRVSGPFMPYGHPVELQPREGIRFTAGADTRKKLSFTFHAQDGLYGYRLTAGREYRLIAIWRPDPKRENSVVSTELRFKTEEAEPEN